MGYHARVQPGRPYLYSLVVVAALIVPRIQCTLPIQPRWSGAVLDLLRWHERCMETRCNVMKRVHLLGN